MLGILSPTDWLLPKSSWSSEENSINGTSVSFLLNSDEEICQSEELRPSFIHLNGQDFSFVYR